MRAIRELANLLPIMVWTCDRDGRCDFFSQRFSDYTGVRALEKAESALLAVVHPDDRDLLLLAWRSSVERAEDYHGELRLRRHDGQYRWFDARAVPIRDAAGQIRGWFGSTTDIHEQRELRELLRQQSERFVKVVATSPGVICSFLLGPDGRASMPFASPAIDDLYGYPAEVLARDMAPAFARIEPVDLARVSAGIDESARAMTPFREEWRYHHPQRGERWIEGHSAPQREPDGSVLWHGIIQDITERRQIDAALRERESLHRSVLAALTEGVLVFDLDGKVVASNPSAERILGITSEEMSRRAVGLGAWRPVHEDGSPMSADDLPSARTLRTGRPVRGVVRGEILHDGRLVWLLVNAEPMFDERSGQISGVVVSFTDVTSHKEAELAVRRSEERFKRAFSCGPPGLVLRRAGDWEVVEVNEAFLAIAGCTRADVIGPTSRFVPRELLPQLVVACERDAVVRDLEIVFTPRRGEPRVLLASSERLELAEGDSVLCFFHDHTERKRAEAALRASEASFRHIFELAPVAIWYQDWSGLFALLRSLAASGPVDLEAYLDARPELGDAIMASVRTIDANDRAVRYFGASDKAELLGRGMLLRSSPDLGRLIRGAMLAISAGRDSYDAEMSVATLTGEVRHVIVATRFPTHDPEAGRVLVCLTDISERKQLERRLAMQAAVGRVLAEHDSLAGAAPALVRALCDAEGWDFGSIWEVDPDLDRLTCVDLWYRPELRALPLAARTRALTMARGEGVPGRVWQSGAPLLIRDVTRERWYLRGVEAGALGLRSSMAFPILAGDKVVGVVDFLSCRERLDDPQLADLFENVGRQLGSFSERVRAESLLQDSRQRFQIVASATSDVLWDWNLRSGRLWWSDGLAELLGDESRPGPGVAWWIERIHPDDRARIVARFDHAITGETSAWSDEYRFRRADGSYADVHDRGQLLRDAGGIAERMIGGMVDVTTRKRAEAEVRRLADELEERVSVRTAELEGANHELEAFSYSVSHDLRAPLRAVNGFAEMLMEDHGHLLPPDGVRLLTTIRDSAGRMGTLIDDLLMLSRLSRQPVRRVTIDVEVLVRDVLTELRGAPDYRPVEVRVGPLAPCSGDPGLLRQVWTNLLENAMKYSSKIAAPVVEVSSSEQDGDVEYEVRDNGAGFDMRYAHKLFKVFQRLHRNDEFEGTGVGLAIVHRIVTRHGGRVWAEAAVDRGASFHFTIGQRGA